ncbi:MAG: DUF4080 domain-containing protein [Peptococcaceae bacterium]|nr:DUF4080 domain-containing protein [Peptococcaceae bacterium]
MKAVLLGVNASFSHTSLAVRYLAAACLEKGVALTVVEANINERAENIALRLLGEEPALLLCSVYIWNRNLVEDVCTRLSTMLPELIVVWGGPEVSGNPANLFAKLSFLDYLCQGEGELLMPHLLTALREGRVPKHTGISTRENLEVGSAQVKNLDELPDPYDGEESYSPHKLYYFETSRGCPYSCAYCLSAGGDGVRFMSVDLAKLRLASLSAKVGLIKFVDRTFNADARRARELWSYLLELPGSCRFHFEICAHLLTEADFALLADPRAKRFQFEVGLQTTSPEALALIHRHMSADRVLENVRRLVAAGNVEVHLDLICGLPGEGLADFMQSFDAALGALPDRLHLGFLKVLPGTSLSSLMDEGDYGVLPYAPYEVLRAPGMSPQAFLRVKKMEQALERFYNSRRSRQAVLYALKHTQPNELFASLLGSSLGEGSPEEALCFALATKVPDRYLLQELCRFDFLMHEPHREVPPSLILGVDEERRLLRGIVYGDKENLYKVLPHRRDEKPGAILRHLRLGTFNPATMAHLGLAGRSACLFDHTLPPRERAIAVFLDYD